MRRLLIPMALVLAVAACSDDDAQDAGTTATTAAAVTTSTPASTTQASTTTSTAPTTDTTKPRTEGVARSDKKDPAGMQIAALSKISRPDRGDEEATEGPPSERGQDPRLDVLWEECAGGDLSACDDLYRESPVGSDYERFGDTCGNRTEGGAWCSEVSEEPLGYGDDPYFDALWEACAEGDMTACDTLYVEAPIGSEYEEFGYTCGMEADGTEWCVEAFPASGSSLEALYGECDAENWEACDRLFIEAPPGSEYEQFGATCGNRTDGMRWCVAEFSDADAYGSDPYFDALWDACAAGSMAACDALYLESPVGSEYEEFGATCGNQTDGIEWCVLSMAGEVADYGDDPYLDALWDACADEDWEACDQLFAESPLGSVYEEFGATCGYQTDGTEWCADLFGGSGIFPYTYGDDAYLDGLWDDCTAGDWDACDLLYSDSPVGSEYETYGETCGFLTDGTEWCADVFGQDSPPGEGPQTYGDDEYFDGLWDACAAEDWQACDTLYIESPVGSDYEEFGNTCGGRTDGAQWCTDVYGDGEPSGDAFTYGDDPYLDALWDACAAEDWQACDDLFLESPGGSEYEEFGATCGYRTEGEDWCVDVMG
jgi:hypothetical protein